MVLWESRGAGSIPAWAVRVHPSQLIILPIICCLGKHGKGTHELARPSHMLNVRLGNASKCKVMELSADTTHSINIYPKPYLCMILQTFYLGLDRGFVTSTARRGGWCVASQQGVGGRGGGQLAQVMLQRGSQDSSSVSAVCLSPR